MVSKPKVCKCGHDKTSHNTQSLISLSTQCSKCPCSSYMNRNYPDRSQYFFAYLTIGLGVFFIIASSVIILEADPATTNSQNEIITFTFTNQEFYDLTKTIFYLICLYFVIWLIIEPIIDIYKQKKRRTYPTGD